MTLSYEDDAVQFNARPAEATGCRIARFGAPRNPVGYAPMLEAEARVGAEAIAAASCIARLG